MLLCESDHLASVMMRTFLEFAGYHPVCIKTPRELKATLKDRGCDLVLAAEGKFHELPAWIEAERHADGLLADVPAILLTDTAVFPAATDKGDINLTRADRTNRAALLRTMTSMLSSASRDLRDGTHG